jgi:hypothetical protein
MLASFFLDYLIFMLRFFVPQLFRLIRRLFGSGEKVVGEKK